MRKIKRIFERSGYVADYVNGLRENFPEDWVEICIRTGHWIPEVPGKARQLAMEFIVGCKGNIDCMVKALKAYSDKVYVVAPIAIGIGQVLQTLKSLIGG